MLTFKLDHFEGLLLYLKSYKFCLGEPFLEQYDVIDLWHKKFYPLIYTFKIAHIISKESVTRRKQDGGLGNMILFAFILN